MLNIQPARPLLPRLLLVALLLVGSALVVSRAASNPCDRNTSVPPLHGKDAAGCRVDTAPVNEASRTQATATTPTVSRPRSELTHADFTLVAVPGFGDRGNTWAWTSGYINNRIVVGTGRWITCGKVYASGGTPPPALQCPPQNQMAAAQQAQIWSADASVAHPLTQGDWTMNYQSPSIGGIPVNYAFRGTSVYTDQQNNHTLFVSGVSYGLPSVPPSLLSSSDGMTFPDIPQAPGTTMGDINQISTTSDSQPLGMRGSTEFNGSFIVSITGAQGRGSLFASKTPLQGNNTFQQLTPPSMAVWEIASFNNHLYISLASPAGYGVVRTDCTQPAPGTTACPPSAFTTVIPFGAGIPGNLNNDVESMTVYTDPAGHQHLYVGAGVNPPGNLPGSTPTPRPTGAPPGALTGAELTRINPDDSWDLIVGTPRIVHGVTKQPLSGFDEGFNNVNNKYMWSMDSYNGSLYVGTWNVAYTGCQLWSSADGVAFHPITTNGFGNPQCAGIRTTRGTPYGVFVGTVDDYNGLQVWEGVAPHSRPTSTPTSGPTVTATSTPTSRPTVTATSTSTPSSTLTGTSLTPRVWLPLIEP